MAVETPLAPPTLPLEVHRCLQLVAELQRQLELLELLGQQLRQVEAPPQLTRCSSSLGQALAHLVRGR